MRELLHVRIVMGRPTKQENGTIENAVVAFQRSEQFAISITAVEELPRIYRHFRPPHFGRVNIENVSMASLIELQWRAGKDLSIYTTESGQAAAYRRNGS